MSFQLLKIFNNWNDTFLNITYNVIEVQKKNTLVHY